MIQLLRIRTPSKITRALKGKHLRNKLKSLLIERIRFENQTIEKFNIPSKWKTAKVQLIEEAHGKCAFCECEIPSHQHGDVEHYRPKSIYWWMSYTIDNYLLSCEICNQRKSNNFETRKPKANTGALPAENNDNDINTFLDNFALNPADQNFGDSILGLKHLQQLEKPKLLNPYIDDPEKFFDWTWDEVLMEVEVVPKISLSSTKKSYANYTINLLDLNRAPLKRRRFLESIKFKLTKELGADNQILQTLYLTNECEYASMNRFFNTNGF